MASRISSGLACLLCFTLLGEMPAQSQSRREASHSGSQQQSLSRDVIRELNAKMTEQQQQIEQLRSALEEQKKLLHEILRLQASAPNAPSPQLPRLGEVASAAAMIPAPAATAALAPQNEPQSAELPSPLQFQLGSASFTPVGFMDLTGSFRSTNAGTGIGTNFGSIPFSDTSAGKLSEIRLSTQNSRVGLRVDATAAGANVLGYLEADFLGVVPANAAVSSNSDTLRLRQYWVDVRKGRWEVLGGQSWSMLTPNRKGLSPLPSDLFSTQNIDVNYQAGLVWQRTSNIRMIYHPTDKLAAGLSLENPEQYIGGSAGGGLVVLPTAFQSNNYFNQLNNGNTSLAVPGFHPDIIAKIAYDTKTSWGTDFHLEAAGVARTFRLYNPLNNTHYSTTGGGGSVNLNFDLVKNFRFLTNNYWSDGGGREIFGQAPDLIVRGDGSASAIHSGSTVTGFEATAGNSQVAFYYGGIYVQRNTAVDPATGRLVGYGYPSSPSGQNRTIQELTFDWNHTYWKDAKFGALNLMFQYSYLFRKPWSVAAGQPQDAHFHMVMLNLRYTLPGSAPTIKH